MSGLFEEWVKGYGRCFRGGRGRSVGYAAAAVWCRVRFGEAAACSAEGCVKVFFAPEK
jgi:hypothetical protein